jgi:hypothetical protein
MFHRRELLRYRNGTWIQENTDAVPNKDNESPKQVMVTVKFNDFNGASTLQQNVNLGVEISMYWRNDYVNWAVNTTCSSFSPAFQTPCPTYDVYELIWDPSVMWVPDLQLANDAVPFDQGFPSNLKAIVDYAGGSAYVLTGQITYSCNFVMTDFPFDTQSCDAVS